MGEVMRIAESFQEGSGLQQSLGPRFHSISAGRGRTEKAPPPHFTQGEGETQRRHLLPEVTQQGSGCFSPQIRRTLNTESWSLSRCHHSDHPNNPVR